MKQGLVVGATSSLAVALCRALAQGGASLALAGRDEEELQLLELLRHRLGIDRLVAAAIERGARARFQTL